MFGHGKLAESFALADTFTIVADGFTEGTIGRREGIRGNPDGAVENRVAKVHSRWYLEAIQQTMTADTRIVVLYCARKEPKRVESQGRVSGACVVLKPGKDNCP